MNVASRISECAGPGEICFSEDVFNNIRNREELEVIPVGEKELKNVAYKLYIHKIITLHKEHLKKWKTDKQN